MSSEVTETRLFVCVYVFVCGPGITYNHVVGTLIRLHSHTMGST